MKIRDCRTGHDIYWESSIIDKIGGLEYQMFRCRNCGKIFKHTKEFKSELIRK